MLAGLLALALSVTVTSPAAARKPDKAPSTPSPGRVEIQPTEQELAAQRATRRAKQEVQTATDAVSRARASLRQAALEAGDALEASATATRRLELAEQEDARQRDLLTGARLELAGQRAQLGRWAREAYRDGGTVGANLTVLTLLGSGSGTDIGGALTWLERVGRDKSRVVQAVQAAEAAQASATGRSQAAASAAAQAAVDAAAARGRAQAAMARQQAELGRLENALALSTRRQDAAVNRQRAIEAQTRGTGDNRVTGAVGDCRGGAVEQYPNGQIPLEALCPLALAPAHRLRADAAHAFDRLGRAYAGPVRHPAVRHRLLPHLRAAGPAVRAEARPGRGPGQQQPRLGHRARHVRWDPGLRHRAVRLDAGQRAAVRLVPPGVGAGGRNQAGTLALGVRG